MPNITAQLTNLAPFDSSVRHYLPSHSLTSGPCTSLKRKRTASAPDEHTSSHIYPLLNQQQAQGSKFSDEETQSNPDTFTYTLPSSTSPKSPTSSTNYTVCPLTAENLRLFTMEAGGDLTKTTSASKTTTTLSATNVYSIKLYFQSNGLFIGNKDALKRCPEIMTKAKAIVGRDRNLMMDDEEWGVLEQKIVEYKDFNELTFLVNVWLELIPTTRKTRQGDQSQHPGMTIGDISNIDNPAVWTQRAWDNDFLSVIWSADFTRVNNLLKPGDAIVRRVINIKPRLKTPRPDLTFGFKVAAFSQNHRDLAVGLGANLQVGLVHPFFAVEAKNALGSLAEAELQCCRAGTAMVHASRNFNAAATAEPGNPGADQSFVFTLALTPVHATIYVHWAEVEADGNVIYHQHNVDSFNMEKKHEVNSLRQAIYNVLDWGLFERKKEIFDTCTKMLNLHQEQMEQGHPSKKPKVVAL